MLPEGVASTFLRDFGRNLHCSAPSALFSLQALLLSASPITLNVGTLRYRPEEEGTRGGEIRPIGGGIHGWVDDTVLCGVRRPA